MNNGWFSIAVMVSCCWFCGLCFLCLGLFFRRYQKPAWFWSGSTVKPETITDIPAYNRANSRMWILFSVPFWVCGLLGFWWLSVSAIILTVACLVGLPVLIVAYNKIYKKYKVNDYE